MTQPTAPRKATKKTAKKTTPPLATGGVVEPGQPVVIGERGPELLPPASLPEIRPVDATPILVVIIPTKGRPQNIRTVLEAWDATDAWADAAMLLVVEQPEIPAYEAVVNQHGPLAVEILPTGAPGYAPGANWAARWLLENAPQPVHMAVHGDDHVPGTVGWAKRYREELDHLNREFGAGMVYGDDGLRGEKLCTEWAVTWSWVHNLNRIVPALVRHLYSDTSVLDLAKAAGICRYLPDVSIRHMHPLATVDGKQAAAWDEQYRRVNSDAQRAADLKVYQRWSTRPLESDKAGLVNQCARLRALRP